MSWVFNSGGVVVRSNNGTELEPCNAAMETAPTLLLSLSLSLSLYLALIDHLRQLRQTKTYLSLSLYLCHIHTSFLCARDKRL